MTGCIPLLESPLSSSVSIASRNYNIPRRLRHMRLTLLRPRYRQDPIEQDDPRTRSAQIECQANDRLMSNIESLSFQLNLSETFVIEEKEEKERESLSRYSSAENPTNSRKMHRAARRCGAYQQPAGWSAHGARHPFAARAAFCSPDTHVALRLRQTYRAAATSACRFSPRVAPRLSPRRAGGCVRRAPRARHDALRTTLDDQCRARDPARERRAVGRSLGGEGEGGIAEICERGKHCYGKWMGLREGGTVWRGMNWRGFGKIAKIVRRLSSSRTAITSNTNLYNNIIISHLSLSLSLSLPLRSYAGHPAVAYEILMTPRTDEIAV